MPKRASDEEDAAETGDRKGKGAEKARKSGVGRGDEAEEAREPSDDEADVPARGAVRRNRRRD
jgi:hypothetical protein